MLKLFRILAFLFALHFALPANSQIYPIPGGPVIPGNGPTCFTFNVSGVGIIYPPGWGWNSPYIDYVTIDSILTTHPQTLVITLVSPAGTSLTLSAYNGAG